MTDAVWRRSDVHLGQLYDRDGLTYRVVALIDDPVVVLRPADDRDGDDDEHYVIGSPLFAQFKRVQWLHPSGSVEESRDDG